MNVALAPIVAGARAIVGRLLGQVGEIVGAG